MSSNIEPGVYPEMTSDEYHSLHDILGSSSIKKKCEKGVTMKAWKHYRETPFKVTDPMILGDAIHTAVLEPEFYDSRYVTWKGGRRAGKDWKQFQEDSAGFTILTEVQDERARATAQFIKQEKEDVYRILSDGQRELSYFANDPETGIPMKARADFISGNGAALLDLKSSSDITDYARSKALIDKGYAIQLAYYMRVMGLASEVKPQSAYILWVSTTGVIDAVMDEVEPRAIEWGEKRCQAALAEIKECMESGVYPGLHHRKNKLDLPGWVYEQEESAA